MDTGKGRFEQINEEKFKEQLGKPKSRVFKVGEILEIRGSRLRCEQITMKSGNDIALIDVTDKEHQGVIEIVNKKIDALVAARKMVNEDNTLKIDIYDYQNRFKTIRIDHNH